MDLVALLPNHSCLFKVSDPEMNGRLQRIELLCDYRPNATTHTLQINLHGKDGAHTERESWASGYISKSLFCFQLNVFTWFKTAKAAKGKLHIFSSGLYKFPLR